MTNELKFALTLSVGLHAAAFISVPPQIEPVAFDIDRGPSSLEVYLVTPTPPPPEPEPSPASQFVPKESEPQPQTIIAPEHQGAITNALPNYRRNPPPLYPQLARQRGYQGTVLVEVHVSSLGRTQEVHVAESSGHEVLDEAALRAVRQWIFKPARRGHEPVPFVVDIPITFRLIGE